jgi:indoleamine 2,3-dioxygenase
MKSSASAVAYLALLDQVREFRERHWRFTKEYIIKHTDVNFSNTASRRDWWITNHYMAA